MVRTPTVREYFPVFRVKIQATTGRTRMTKGDYDQTRPSNQELLPRSCEHFTTITVSTPLERLIVQLAQQLINNVGGNITLQLTLHVVLRQRLYRLRNSRPPL